MHRVLAIPYENLSVLNGALQLHAALRKRDQGTTPIQRHVHHGQIGQPLERSPVVLPPLVSATTAISIEAGQSSMTPVKSFCQRSGSSSVLSPRPNDKASCA